MISELNQIKAETSKEIATHEEAILRAKVKLEVIDELIAKYEVIPKETTMEPYDENGDTYTPL